VLPGRVGVTNYTLFSSPNAGGVGRAGQDSSPNSGLVTGLETRHPCTSAGKASLNGEVRGWGHKQVTGLGTGLPASRRVNRSRDRFTSVGPGGLIVGPGGPYGLVVGPGGLRLTLVYGDG